MRELTAYEVEEVNGGRLMSPMGCINAIAAIITIMRFIDSLLPSGSGSSSSSSNCITESWTTTDSSGNTTSTSHEVCVTTSETTSE